MKKMQPYAGAIRLGRLLIVGLLTYIAVSCGGSTSSNTAPGGGGSPPAVIQDRKQPVIVQCAADCGETAAAIVASNGSVQQQFQNVQALVAQVPTSQIPALRSNAAVSVIEKDALIAVPAPRDAGPLTSLSVKSLTSITKDRTLASKSFVLPARSIRTETLTITSGAGNQQPRDFLHDLITNGAAALHEAGNFGEDVVVAIIDSGTANNSTVVPALDGSIVGGENLVDAADEPSATSTLNDDHGTWVGTMIAGHGAAVVNPDSELLAAVQRYAPDSVIPQDDGTFLIPMVGTAPGAKLYAIKVFGVTEEGAPRSRTLAAMDRALTLKKNFDAGGPTTPTGGDGSEDDPYVYDALNVQVVNLSLGGATLFAGNSLEDQLVQQMLASGIVVVAAAGNEGFGALTVGSPGGAIGALAVGAANPAEHERILRDLQFGPGAGLDYRPTDYIQVADFSSRGPNADGRSVPDLIANGLAVFVQGADGQLALVSGTSFSTPTVAGAAALLAHAQPDAIAADIRAALIQSANPELVGGSPTALDQGNGFLDVARAAERLKQGDFDGSLPALPAPQQTPALVQKKLAAAGIPVLDLVDRTYETEFSVKPGEARQIYINSPLNIDSITVSVSEITPALPTDEQNAIFGDDVDLLVLDGPLSTNEVRVDEFLVDDASFTVDKLQPGVLRVAVLGDWTNAGAVSAKLRIAATTRSLPKPTFAGRVTDQETDQFTINVARNTPEVNFELSWPHNWRYNPGHDIDLILVDPNGEMIFDGATLASPERVTIADPLPGLWTILVDGYELHGFTDPYGLTITDNRGRPLVTQDDDD